MEQVVNMSNAQVNQPGGGHARRLFYDKCGRCLFIASACLMTLMIFSMIFFVGKQGLLTLADVSPVKFFTSAAWDPSAKHFGALSFILGSLETTLLSVLIGAPLGLLGAIFLSKLAPVPVKRIMRPAVDLYVAIPSVVYGYIGLTLFVPFLSATWWQTMIHVVLPSAIPGVHGVRAPHPLARHDSPHPLFHIEEGGRRMMNAKVQNEIAKIGLWLVGFFILGLLAAFLGYILYKGLPVLNLHFIFGKSSDILAGGGVGSQLFNSFYMLFLSMAVSIPLALGAGIYLAEYARENRLTKCIRLSVESLATVPSIVLGLFGMIIFVNQMHLGFSILGGSLTLVLLNLPMLVRVTEESIRTVPHDYEEASLALGATKLQTVFKVILPSAMPGIITGITLTAGRALGETAILIFTAGTTVSRFLYDTDVMAGGETLAVHLWYLLSAGLVPDRDTIANGIGALLILTILVFNFLLVLPLKYFQRHSVGR